MLVGKALLLVLVAEKARSSSGEDLSWATPAACPLGFDDCNAKCDTDFPLDDDTYDFSYTGASYGYGGYGSTYFYFEYDIAAGDMEIANGECKAQCAAKCPLPPPPPSPFAPPPAAPLLANSCANKLKFGATFYRVAPVWNKRETNPCQGGRCCKQAEGITEDTCNVALSPVIAPVRRQRSLLFAKVPATEDDGLDGLLDTVTDANLESADAGDGEVGSMFLCYWDGGKCKGKFVSVNQAQTAECMEVAGKVATSYS